MERFHPDGLDALRMRKTSERSLPFRESGLRSIDRPSLLRRLYLLRFRHHAGDPADPVSLVAETILT